ncbi:MAG: hypothetical protein EOP09_05610, partial [Proteobacteria bacterium]
SKVLWALGLATAAMTAFYMTRLMALTFWGAPRYNEKDLGAHHGHDHHHEEDDHGHAHAHAAGHDDHAHGHASGVHESPPVMTIPLIVLGLLSVVGGVIGLPTHWIDEWLAPVVPIHDPETFTAGHTAEHVLMVVSVLVASGAAFFAYRVYKNVKGQDPLQKALGSLHKTLENKWYIDELYEKSFVRPIHKFSLFLWKGIDVAVIDRLVMGFGTFSQWSGRAARVIQTGSIQAYALLFIFGLILSLGYLLYGLV